MEHMDMHQPPVCAGAGEQGQADRRCAPPEILPELFLPQGDLSAADHPAEFQLSLIPDTNRADVALPSMLPPNLYRQCLDLANEALVAFDREGKVLFANRACTALLARPAEEIVGLAVQTLFGPSLSLCEGALMEELAAHGFYKGEWEWVAPDGQVVPLRVTLRRMAFANRGDTLYVASLQEVSTLRALEEKLRHTQRFEAVASLATGIAHDLKNFLAGIMGCARCLLAELDEGHAHYDELKSIAETASTAIDLTERLLALTRSTPSQMLVCSLNQLVEKTASLLARSVATTIRVRLCLCEDLPSILCNPSQIEQVLMNLGINGAEAMPQGGELVFRTGVVDFEEARWEVVPQTGPGRYVFFSVQDTGTGIPAYLRRKIFEPLFTTKQPGKGIGMGLAVVEGIVREHQGMIAVDSRVGVGSRFTVYLPVAGSEQTEVPAREAMEA
ncbi:MAG: two-component system sensor histidine kinase NtrB [Candidatus Oleimicrobiaceae bacterium]